MSIERIITAIDKNIIPESKVISTAIIEGKNKIVYSTENWDISSDIDNINLVWGSEEAKEFTISGVKYVILQTTPERLVASAIDKGKKKASIKEGIVGFRDDERTIVCKVPQDGPMNIAFMQSARVIGSMSSKEPYLVPDATLGKVEELKWATPRVLPNDTLNLQSLGLLKFGLTEEEAEVYLAFLKKGDFGDTIGNINRELLNLKRTHIYRIIDRLEKNNWVRKMIDSDRKAQKYRAISLNFIIDDFIEQKETELMILRSFRYILGEKLENGWINVSDLERDLQDMYHKKFDFNTLGITGVEKDCGLIIFEYESPVNKDVIIRAALQLSFEKIRAKLFIQEDIEVEEQDKYDEIEEGYKNPDLEDIKIVDTTLMDLYGADINIRFKKGSETANNVGEDWVIAAKQVAVPIENKIYIVWGSEEKFPYLLNLILKIR
jgi:predicted transcriptional regulator